MHYAKIANRAEYAILQHNSRALNNHKNKNIDVQKSKHNKDLMTLIHPADNRAPYEKFQDRLKELSYRKQKNNIRMCEIVLTAPKNIPQKDLGRFFKAGLKELSKQVGGADNIVAAYVHLDEKSPHMHVDFVPGIEVDGVLKLSAKRLIDRDKLKDLHPAVQKAIDTEFGHHNYLVVADEQADRGQSSESLQAFKAAKDKEDKLRVQYQSIKNSYDKAVNNLMAIQYELDKNNKAVDSLKTTIEKLKEDKAIFSQEASKMLKYSQNLNKYINDIYEQAEQAGVADLELATHIIAELEKNYPEWVAELREQTAIPLYLDEIEWNEYPETEF